MFAPNTSAAHHAGCRDVRAELGDFDDHLHPLALENGSIVGRVDFDYSLLDGANPEDSVTVSKASSAFSEILGWIIGKSDDLKNAGARAASLGVLLNPRGRYRSLAAVARDSDLSRAIISQWLLELRDAHQIKMNLRGSEIRSNCREAQNRAVQNGRHSSTKTRKIPNMNAQQIRKQFRTLDAAVTEIERLNKTQSSTQSTSATKTPGATAPQLGDLNQQEIMEAMDLASKSGDREMLRLLYSELNARRRPI
jgi:hypothetical protein